MAKRAHLRILKQGVNSWNQWRAENPAMTPDLEGANLFDANLRGANLRRANLLAADFLMADLGGVDFAGADLTAANLSSADLRGADLRGAILHVTGLRGTDLENSDFTDAEVGWTGFGDNDLSTVKGLETVGTSAHQVSALTQFTNPKAIFPKPFCAARACPRTSSPT